MASDDAILRIVLEDGGRSTSSPTQPSAPTPPPQSAGQRPPPVPSKSSVVPTAGDTGTGQPTPIDLAELVRDTSLLAEGFRVLLDRIRKFSVSQTTTSAATSTTTTTSTTQAAPPERSRLTPVPIEVVKPPKPTPAPAAPPVAPPSTTPPATIDFMKSLISPAQGANPHVLLEGQSGSGKSLAAKHIAFERMKQGQDVHVVDTHTPEAWGGAKQVFQGPNKQAGEEVAEFLRSTLESRKAESSAAKLRGEQPDFKPMTVVFSDFARLMKDVPQLGVEFATILTEARKFKISIVADTTSLTGASSGIKGIQDVLQNFGQKVKFYAPTAQGDPRRAEVEGAGTYDTPQLPEYKERVDYSLVKPPKPPPPPPPPSFDPVALARKRIEREEQMAAVDAEYAKLKPQVNKGAFDAVVEIAESLRGTIGGTFGRVVGAILDITARLRNVRAKAAQAKNQQDRAEAATATTADISSQTTAVPLAIPMPEAIPIAQQPVVTTPATVAPTTTNKPNIVNPVVPNPALPGLRSGAVEVKQYATGTTDSGSAQTALVHPGERVEDMTKGKRDVGTEPVLAELAPHSVVLPKDLAEKTRRVPAWQEHQAIANATEKLRERKGESKPTLSAHSTRSKDDLAEQAREYYLQRQAALPGPEPEKPTVGQRIRGAISGAVDAIRPSNLLRAAKGVGKLLAHPSEAVGKVKDKYSDLQGRYGKVGAGLMGAAYAGYYATAAMNPAMLALPVPVTGTLVAGAEATKYVGRKTFGKHTEEETARFAKGTHDTGSRPRKAVVDPGERIKPADPAVVDPSEMVVTEPSKRPSFLSRPPKNKDEALALAFAARSAVIGDDDDIEAEDGSCLTAARCLRALGPEVEVWSGEYLNKKYIPIMGGHQIVKVGKFFIDITADQYNSMDESGRKHDPVRVFTQDDIETGVRYEYSNFRRTTSSEKNYDEYPSNAQSIIEEAKYYENSDFLALPLPTKQPNKKVGQQLADGTTDSPSKAVVDPGEMVVPSSTGNRGTFDPSNPDISYATGTPSTGEDTQRAVVDPGERVMPQTSIDPKKAAIEDWSHTLYRASSSPLPTEDERSRLQSFHKAIADVPNYSGMLYRTIVLDSPTSFVGGTLAKNEIIRADRPLSTSKSSKAAIEFNSGTIGPSQTMVVMQLSAKSGADISNLVAEEYKDQEEVVVRPGTEYVINNITRGKGEHGGQVIYVNATEKDSNSWLAKNYLNKIGIPSYKNGTLDIGPKLTIAELHPHEEVIPKPFKAPPLQFDDSWLSLHPGVAARRAKQYALESGKTPTESMAFASRVQAHVSQRGTNRQGIYESKLTELVDSGLPLVEASSTAREYADSAYERNTAAVKKVQAASVGNKNNIPKYAGGAAYIPGDPSEESPAILHGGEGVIPTEQNKRLQDALKDQPSSHSDPFPVGPMDAALDKMGREKSAPTDPQIGGVQSSGEVQTVQLTPNNIEALKPKPPPAAAIAEPPSKPPVQPPTTTAPSAPEPNAAPYQPTVAKIAPPSKIAKIAPEEPKAALGEKTVYGAVASVAEKVGISPETLDKITIAIPVIGLAASAISGFANIANNMANKYGEYSPVIAQEQAMAEMRMTMNDMRRAQSSGQELADLVKAQSEMQNQWEEIKLSLMKKLIPVITKIVNILGALFGIAAKKDDDEGIEDPVELLFKSGIKLPEE